MNKTKELLQSIVGTGTPEMSLSEISRLYKGSLNPSLLSLAFIQLYKLIIHISQGYYGIDDEDLASYSLEELDYALTSYDEKSETKLVTYFINLLKNRLREETQKLATNKRKAINNSNSYEQLAETGFVAGKAYNRYESFLEMDLGSCDLSEKEEIYCKLVTQDYTNSEIADILNVSVMTLSNYRKKLKIKLQPLALRN